MLRERAASYLQPVDPFTLVDLPRRVVTATDFGAADYRANDFTFAPIPGTKDRPLATVEVTEVLAPTLFPFGGTFDAGTYRVVYERGALYYGRSGGIPNRLWINSFGSNLNGHRIRIPGPSYPLTSSLGVGKFIAIGASFAEGDEVLVLNPVPATMLVHGRHYVVREPLSGEVFGLSARADSALIDITDDMTGGQIKGGDLRAPGFQTPDDLTSYDDDPRSETELLEEIAATNAGREVIFTHPGGDLAMYLSDAYGDNTRASIPPRFSIYAV